MPKTLTVSKGKIQLFPVLIAILAFIILVSLGIWQVCRLKEKQLFLNLISTHLNNVPIDLKTLSGDKYYAKIVVRGKFLQDKNLHLYGRRAMSTEKDGYYLITPFKTEDNKIILVTRGWFGSSYKKNIDNIVRSSSNINQIIGVILPGEQKRLFILNNDVKNNIWFTLDLQEVSNVLGLKLEEFYLLMDNDSQGKQDILKPLKIENLLHIKNDHLEYAITWFALAIALAVIFIMANWRKVDKMLHYKIYKGSNMMLKVGDNAPAFTMLVGENNSISLSELAGKFVVLYFYPKDDTPGCTIEARDFNKLKSAFEKMNAVIIGVSKDDLNAHDKFKKKYCLEFDLASDLNSDTCEQYGVWEEKSLFGKKYMSIERTTFLIDSKGKIAHIWQKVKVKGHAEEVLKQIESYTLLLPRIVF